MNAADILHAIVSVSKFVSEQSNKETKEAFIQRDKEAMKFRRRNRKRQN